MLKTKELIKILERNGFIFVRSSKHMIYRKESVTVAVPHHNTASIGLCRRLLTQAGLKHEIYF